MKKYKYIGDGAGIPGLPYEVSDEEADALGVSDLLVAAIANGKYVSAETTPPQKGGHAGPSRRESKTLESEVNDG